MTPVDILLEAIQVASLHGATPEFVKQQCEKLEDSVENEIEVAVNDVYERD